MLGWYHGLVYEETFNTNMCCKCWQFFFQFVSITVCWWSISIIPM